MRNLGFLLYSEFFYLFILAGFVLLLAMLGTIILTLRRFFKGRIQHPSFQIMRNFETAIKSTKKIK
jgi:NADH-quinone oxidoreductase subunit J